MKTAVYIQTDLVSKCPYCNSVNVNFRRKLINKRVILVVGCNYCTKEYRIYKLAVKNLIRSLQRRIGQ